MSKTKKNFIYLSGYKVFELLLPMITSPLLSRRLGAEALGFYTYNHSIVSFFVILAELGAYRYGLREIAKVRDDLNQLKRTYTDIFFTHLLNGLMIFLIYYVFLLLTHRVDIYSIVFSGFIFSNMIDNSFLFVGLENIGSLSLRDGLTKLITLILIAVFVRSPSDILKYTIIMSFSTIGCKLVALLYSKRYVRIGKPDFLNCKTHYKSMAILMIPAFGAVIYNSMDRVMIGWMYNNADVGYYECATKALIPKNIIASLGTVLCPQIANMYASNRTKEAIEVIKRSFIISMVMAYAFMFGIIAIADDFAPWFWGSDFAVCAPMLTSLAICIPVWTIGEVIRNQFLLPVGRDNEYTVSFVIGVAVNLIINTILIPVHGAMGAIVATIVAELVMSVVQMFCARDTLETIKWIIPTIPYLICGNLMLFIIKFLRQYMAEGALWVLLSEVILGIILFVLFSLSYEGLFKKYALTVYVKKARDKVEERFNRKV